MSRRTAATDLPLRSLPEWPDQVIGGKYVRVLEKHLRALREEQPHGNRALVLDDVFVLALLAFHNPTLRTLRTFDDFSQTRQAQQHLSIRRVGKNTLSDADLAAGVVSDHGGTFRSSSPGRHPVLPMPLREVVISDTEEGVSRTLRLITNLRDVSAATIGRLSRQRRQIELFFRWLKSVANFTPLISHGRDGLLTQMYVTIIGVLLMYLQTGYRPSQYLFALLSTGADLLPLLRERER